MNRDGSITVWINALRGQDSQAAQELWHRYFPRMVALARRQLREAAAGGFDEEDVALSAFNVFCQVIQKDRFPDLQTRDELWPILAKITVHKGIDWQRKSAAQKREAPGKQESVDHIVAEQPAPDVEAIMAEECQRLLNMLDEAIHTKVALLKLDGFSNDEISSATGYSRRTIQRILALIRKRWSAAINESTT